MMSAKQYRAMRQTMRQSKDFQTELSRVKVGKFVTYQPLDEDRSCWTGVTV